MTHPIEDLADQEKEVPQAIEISEKMLASISRRLAPRARRLLSTSAPPPGNPVGKRDSPITWSILGIVIGVGGLAFGYYIREKEAVKERVIQSGTKTIGKPLLGGPFTLVDHHGKTVTDKTLFPEGNRRFGMLYFGFTHCPDICPSEMVKMTKVIDALDAKGAPFTDRVLPVFISVDPKRDGVAQLAHYVKDFHPRTIGLTGTPNQVAKACKAYRVYHSPQKTVNEDEDYLVDHSIVIYLLAPDGEFLDFFTQLAEADEIAERTKRRIVEWDKEHPVQATA